MGIGAAVLCFAAGAILYYAVEMDLPYVDDNTLGAILLLAGFIAAVAAVIASTRRSAGSTSTGTGVGLMVAGAVVYWAIDIDFPFVTHSALSVILMFTGIVTVVATLTMHRQDSKRPETLPRPAVPTTGPTTTIADYQVTTSRAAVGSMRPGTAPPTGRSRFCVASTIPG